MTRSTRIMAPAGPVSRESIEEFHRQIERLKKELEKSSSQLESELYTESEAAEILRTTRTTLRKWRIDGTGPRHTKMGKQVLYRAIEIERYIEERTSGGNETKRQEDKP